jgi:hypothetical protein
MMYQHHSSRRTRLGRFGPGALVVSASTRASASGAVDTASGAAGTSTALPSQEQKRAAALSPLYDASSTKLRKMVEILAATPTEAKFIVFSQWNTLLQVHTSKYKEGGGRRAA